MSRNNRPCSLKRCLTLRNISRGLLIVQVTEDPDSHLDVTMMSLTHKLHQLLGLEEALEMLHLPNAGDDEDERLSDGPPQDALVGALARHAKTLLPILRRQNVQ